MIVNQIKVEEVENQSGDVPFYFFLLCYFGMSVWVFSNYNYHLNTKIVLMKALLFRVIGLPTGGRFSHFSWCLKCFLSMHLG